MTQDKALVGLASLLTTVAEIGSAPDGICYAALMSAGYSFDEYQMIRGSMIRAGWLTNDNHILACTPIGLAKAAEINKATSAKK